MVGVEVSSASCCDMPGHAGDNILVTGALGQIGTDLVSALRKTHGTETVIATDIYDRGNTDGPFMILDILEIAEINRLIRENSIGTIYNLAAILSAHGEKDPDLCERVNLGGLQNILDASKENRCRVFSPSSIAVFGPDSRPIAYQDSPTSPTTVYGKTKKKGEEMMLKYWRNEGVDTRGIRYPGLLSWKTIPTGGTTDYAVEVFHHIEDSGEYTYFVEEDTKLPMMMMEDAIRATKLLMEAPQSKLSEYRTGYNVRGLSFTAKQLSDQIKRYRPQSKFTFTPDERQLIANSWPEDLEDSAAVSDWNWNSSFDLDRMVKTMLDGFSQSSSSDSSKIG